MDSIEYQFQSITGQQIHKMFKDKAISLLPKDREDTRNAYIAGRVDAQNGMAIKEIADEFSADYFVRTFTQYKTQEHE